MRIYTEVNYIWKDNKLIQTDSKSFDYEGNIDKCDKKWYRHNHALTNAITGGGKKAADIGKDVLKKGADYGKDVVTKTKDTVAEGPKGDFKNTVDQLYGGNLKDAVGSVQQTYRDFEGGVKNVKDQVIAALFPQSLLPNYGDDDTTTDNPLLEEDTGPGSRGTASGRMSEASGRSTAGRRGIEKKDRPRSLINQQMQKRLA